MYCCLCAGETLSFFFFCGALCSSPPCCDFVIFDQLIYSRPPTAFSKPAIEHPFPHPTPPFIPLIDSTPSLVLPCCYLRVMNIHECKKCFFF